MNNGYVNRTYLLDSKSFGKRMRGRGRRIRDAFFTRVSPKYDQWVCNCGTKRKNTGTGYTNLFSHVQSQHPEDFKNCIEDLPLSSASQNTQDTIFYKKKTIQVHGWLDVIINGLQPFYIVESEVFRRSEKFETLRYKRLSKYRNALTYQSSEAKIRKLLPMKFFIIFDDWSSQTTYYVGVFAAFPYNTPHGYARVLVGFSLLEREDSLSAENHSQYILYVQESFDRSIDNVVCIIGDNCAVNR